MRRASKTIDDVAQPEAETNCGSPGVAALERGLALLEAFKQGKGTLSLAELAAITGFHKSTILRLATSLLKFGYLYRINDGRFRLGPAVFPLGRVYQDSFKLRDAVVPILRGLVTETGETASFYIRDGENEICLHRASSPLPVRDAGVEEGQRFPIDESTCSQVMSAFSGWPGSEYDALRRQVVALSRPSRRVSGVAALACPVFAVGPKLAGVVLLSGPESRFTDDAVARFRMAVLEHAARMTRALGGDAAAIERAMSA